MNSLSIHILTDLLFVLNTAILICASLHDVAARSIPNWMSGVLTALGVAARILDDSILHSIPTALAVFMAAVFCWRRGWMGGGDVKLLGATATIVPPAAVLSLIILVALAGGLLAFIYLAARQIVPVPTSLTVSNKPIALPARIRRAECWRIRRGCPLPYACAIAAGAILSQCITGV